MRRWSRGSDRGGHGGCLECPGCRPLPLSQGSNKRIVVTCLVMMMAGSQCKRRQISWQVFLERTGRETVTLLTCTSSPLNFYVLE